MTPQPQQQIYQIDRMVNSFSRLMKMKLHENLHKGTWENCTYDYLRSRIDDELKEFDVAIEEGRYIDATVEAADIGNFLAMIRENIDFGRFDNYTRTSRPAPSQCPYWKETSCHPSGEIGRLDAGQERIWQCTHPAPAPIEDTLDHLHDQYRTSRPAPSPLEKVLLCFGNYWECPIDEEECEVSDPCHQKAIRDREHDEQVKRKAREEGAKQERERIVKILESWNPFQTTFGEVMESLCKQHEGASP